MEKFEFKKWLTRPFWEQLLIAVIGVPVLAAVLFLMGCLLLVLWAPVLCYIICRKLHADKPAAEFVETEVA